MVNVQGSQDRLGVERHYDRGFHRGDGWVEARLEYSAFLIHRHLRITVRLHSSPRTPRPSPERWSRFFGQGCKWISAGAI